MMVCARCCSTLHCTNYRTSIILDISCTVHFIAKWLACSLSSNLFPSCMQLKVLSCVDQCSVIRV